MAAWVVPLIGAGIGAAANLFSSFFNRSSAESANATNIALAREQREWEQQMWRLQNEYNLPANQMERFKQAGLNPNLVYSQGNPGNAASVGNYQRANVQAPRLDLDFNSALNMYMDFRMKGAQVDNLQAQNDLIRQQAVTEGMRAKEVGENVRSKELQNRLEYGAYGDPDMATYYTEAKRARLQSDIQSVLNLRRQYELQGKDLEVRDIDIVLGSLRTKIAEKELISKSVESQLNRLGVSTHDNIVFRALAKLWSSFVSDPNLFIPGDTDYIETY